MNAKARFLKNVYAAYTLGASTVLSRHHFGTNVYDREWDLLIVLDACRVDTMEQVAAEYDFLGPVESIRSVGSTSKEWIDRTFVEGYEASVAETAYVTANTFASNLRRSDRITHRYTEFMHTAVDRHPWLSAPIKDDILRAESFGIIDSLWGVPGEDNGFMSVRHPENVTDHAIWVGRNTNFDRRIVHYMQPHAPYFASADSYEDLADHEREPFTHLKQETHSREEIFDLYIENLRYVMEYVERLLENTDAETVAITADHGELFGEWGLYGHHACLPHPALRRVPWVTATATDEHTYDPDIDRSDIERSDRVSDEELAALGYLEQ